MGSEIGQTTEWNHDASVVWDLLDNPQHAGVQRLIRDLNRIYGSEPALQFSDLNSEGFEWAVGDDAENSIFGMFRFSEDRSSCILALSNMTPIPRHGYRIGVYNGGRWAEILNTDAAIYGGSNVGNSEVWSDEQPSHGKPQSISVALPPLSTIYLRWRG
jgi:1,4-alpha-glucan branching enzyme